MLNRSGYPSQLTLIVRPGYRPAAGILPVYGSTRIQLQWDREALVMGGAPNAASARVRRSGQCR